MVGSSLLKSTVTFRPHNSLIAFAHLLLNVKPTFLLASICPLFPAVSPVTRRSPFSTGLLSYPKDVSTCDH